MNYDETLLCCAIYSFVLILFTFCKKIHKKFINVVEEDGGTAVAQWLRCCATNRKVVDSIPAGVLGIFH